MIILLIVKLTGPQSGANNMREQSFRNLISGQSRGPFAAAARGLLGCASVPYGMLMRLRNFAFDTGIRPSRRVRVPVIAIGNLTTGGTGKTPIVATAVRMLQELGHTPGIVSRGYRADSTGENDEKRVLARLCPGVPHEQNPDRVAAVDTLVSEANVTAIVLDDAFQHRRIARDLNMVLIDATNPFGYGFVLPRGLLREPVASLRRADLVLITRADQVTEQALDEIETTVRKHNPALAENIHRVVFRPAELLTAAGESLSLTSVKDQPVGVMTAIGNPAAFVATCDTFGADVVWKKFFPDHHHFTNSEVQQVLTDSAAAGAKYLLVTLKDLVKIPQSCTRCAAVQIDATFTTAESEAAVRTRLSQCLERVSS